MIVLRLDVTVASVDRRYTHSMITLCVVYFDSSLKSVRFVHVSFFFFFSSRRRHTRLTCDWSSDVCSSDLVITLTFQLTASLLQPAVGLVTDKRPLPYLLPVGMCFTLSGLVLMSVAPTYHVLLLAVALIGCGSSVFHPESSRVARMASGGRYGLAQSVFQIGGNAGQALGPLLAAGVVLTLGRAHVGWFGLAALLGIVVLLQVSRWYSRHIEERVRKRLA